MALVFASGASNILSRSTDILDYDQPYTFMGWFLTTAEPDWSTYYLVQETDGNDLTCDYLQRSQGSDGLILGHNAGAYDETDVGNLALNIWYHLALVHESATSLRGYSNGVAVVQNTTDRSSRIAATHMLVGNIGTGGGTPQLVGRAAYLKAWRRALTPPEIRREMNYVRAVTRSRLYGEWPLDVWTRGLDISGFNRHWTVGSGISASSGPGPPQVVYEKKSRLWVLDPRRYGLPLSPSPGAAFESLTSIGYASRTNTTLTAPSGILDNEILVGIMFNEGATTITPPSGFASWIDQSYTAGGGTGHARAYWKRASSESGSYTFTHSNAPTEAVMIRVSGAATTGTPEDPAPTGNDSDVDGLTTTMTATEVTTTVDGSLLIAAYTAWDDLDPLTPTSGWTERYDAGAGTTVLYVQTKQQSPAGASGSPVVTKNDTATDAWGALLIAVKAASAADAPLQYSRPSGDTSVGTWTTDTGGTTNLYQAIDETAASDSDYIQSIAGP